MLSFIHSVTDSKLATRKKQRNALRMKNSKISEKLNAKNLKSLDENDPVKQREDDCNSETTAESSIYNSQSDSEQSGYSSDRVANVALKKELSNYFYRVAKPVQPLKKNVKTSSRRKKKSVPKETKSESREISPAPEVDLNMIPTASSIHTARQKAEFLHVREAAFVQKMRAMNLSCPSKGCEIEEAALIARTFSTGSDIFSKGIELFAEEDDDLFFEPTISYNPPVVLHSMC